MSARQALLHPRVLGRRMPAGDASRGDDRGVCPARRSGGVRRKWLLSEARRGEASCGVVVGSVTMAKMATTVKMGSSN